MKSLAHAVPWAQSPSQLPSLRSRPTPPCPRQGPPNAVSHPGEGWGLARDTPGGHGCHLALLWVSRGGAVAVAQRLHLRAGVRLLHPGWHCRAPLDARRRYGAFWGRCGAGPSPFPHAGCSMQEQSLLCKTHGVETLRGTNIPVWVGEDGSAP